MQHAHDQVDQVNRAKQLVQDELEIAREKDLSTPEIEVRGYLQILHLRDLLETREIRYRLYNESWELGWAA